VNTNKNFI